MTVIHCCSWTGLHWCTHSCFCLREYCFISNSVLLIPYLLDNTPLWSVLRWLKLQWRQQQLAGLAGSDGNVSEKHCWWSGWSTKAPFWSEKSTKWWTVTQQRFYLRVNINLESVLSDTLHTGCQLSHGLTTVMDLKCVSEWKKHHKWLYIKVYCHSFTTDIRLRCNNCNIHIDEQ